MEKKRIIALSIALILMTIVVGAVFANGSLDGVVWGWHGGQTNIGNTNSYGVRAYTNLGGYIDLDPYETRHLPAEGISIVRVQKL